MARHGIDRTSGWLLAGLWSACGAGLVTTFIITVALMMQWAGERNAPAMARPPEEETPAEIRPPIALNPPREFKPDIIPENPPAETAPAPEATTKPFTPRNVEPQVVQVPPTQKPDNTIPPPLPPAPPPEVAPLPPTVAQAPRRYPLRPVPAPVKKEAQPETLSDDEVTAGIDRGSTALLALIKSDLAESRQFAGRRIRGSAEDYITGEIALGVYSLLTAGKINGDPRLHFTSPEMTDAVQYLLAARPTFTYAAGLQASALSLLPNRPEYRKPLTVARNALLRGNAGGVYSYETLDPPAYGDNSNTQYGQLGIWACQEAGLEVPLSYWTSVNRYWRETQTLSGSWGYGAQVNRLNSGRGLSNGPGTETMTAAGVASLFLAKDDIDRSVLFQPQPDKSLDNGLKWLGDHFADYRPSLSTDLYLAYGLERVALAGGIKTLGTHDWYREGAALILNEQKPDGSWQYQRGSELVGTAYAILFLTRGIAPVAVAELQYNGPWNARSRDCARFVYWLDKQTERQLRWEILPIDSNPDDWRNVPILVITGHGDPGFTADQMATLRKYVQAGGTIFSSADQMDPTFSRLIKQKYAPAICGDKYEMLALGENHPAFTLDYKISPEKRQHLFALSNGVRDLWIHSDDDITAAWQGYMTARSADFEVPANLYFAATGQSSARPHLQPLEPPKPPESMRTITVARLDYAGNADPEPAAWEHFASDIRTKYTVTIQAVPLRIADLDVTRTPIAHITGTTRFHLSSEEERKLGEFLAKGGVLLADAAGGSDAFAISFKQEMAVILPKGTFNDLSADSPVYTGAIADGAPLKELEHRRFDDLGDARTRSLGLMEIQQNGRPVVLFSPGDLTGGINGLRMWGILGYSPETTTAVTWNALLYLSSPPVAAAK